MPKVLVVATSRKTRGGITSVIKAHETGEQWKKYHCKWIETHRDKNHIIKILYLLRGLIQYMYLLPFYNLVHIHMSEPVSALRKLPFMIWAQLWQKKTIIHFHSFSPETTIQSKYRWIYCYLFSNANKIITLSEYWQYIVTNEFKLENKVVVIYNPCTISTAANDKEKINTLREKTAMQSILYAGTVNQRKGYVDMITAFSLIAKKFPNWQLVFAGNGEIEQGKTLAKKLGISQQTQWLGWVNGIDKDHAYREATIFCLPSYAEGFPMAILDAWSYGLPVITTPVGGIPDVAKDGENMLLFAPGDTNKLAQQMEYMITDLDLRKKISIASLNFAKTKFNANTINKEIDNLYQAILYPNIH